MVRSVLELSCFNMILFVLLLLSSGCTLQSAMDCSSGGCVVSGSVNSFIITGVVGGIDSFEDLLLTSAADPSFKIQTSRILNGLTAEVTSLDGLTTYCTQTVAGNVTQVTTTGCGLLNGTYRVTLTGNEAGSSSVFMATANFTKNTWSLPTQNISAFTGETLNLTPSAGVAGFTTNYSGLGYFDLTSFLYTVPMSAGLGTESFQIRDSFNQVVDYNISRKKFTAMPALAVPSSVQSEENRLQSITDDGTTNLYGLTVVTPWDWGVVDDTLLRPMKREYIKIQKSVDGGSSWFRVGFYQLPDNCSNVSGKVIFSNGKLYMLVSYWNRFNTSSWSLQESSDEGNTWSEITNDSDSNVAINWIDLIAADDGSIVIAGTKNNYSTGKSNWFAQKCTSSPATCNDSVLFTPTTENSAYIGGVVKDASGNIYIGGGMMDASFNRYIVIAKSTDDGVTFAKINEFASTAAVGTFDISSDGTKMIFGGTRSFTYPTILLSTDSGATFNLTTDPCTTNYQVAKAKILSSGTLMASCVNYAGASPVYRHARSSNNGSTWSVTSVGNIIYFASALGLHYEFTTSSPFMLRSTSNSGTSYTSRGIPGSIALVPGDSVFMGMLTVDPTTTYIVGASSYTGSTRRGFIKRTTDGTAWSTYFQNTTGSNNIRSIAKSPTTGSIFAVGETVGANLTWNVFRDIGSGFTNIMNWAPASTTGGNLRDIEITSTGRIYLIGSTVNTSVGLRANVRMSTDDGATWTDIDSYQLGANWGAEYIAGTTDGEDLWVGGGAHDSSFKTKWLVRKYSGGIWTTEDLHSFGAGTDKAYAHHVYKAPSGRFYAVGEYFHTSTRTKHAAIRVRNNADGTWSTLQDYVPFPGGQAANYKVLEVDNVLYVAGFVEQPDGRFAASVRILRDNIWSTVDLFIHKNEGRVHDIVPCDTSSVCIVGASISEYGHYLTFLRKVVQ